MRILLFFFSFVIFHAPTAQIPENYYQSVVGKKKDALKTEMKSIIRPHTQRTYADLWEDFKLTDNKGDGVVWDMYSDGTPDYVYYYNSGGQCGNYNSEGDCYNREHSFPKSWFNDAYPMYTDLFHLYPTDGYVNGRRDNFPFGEVGNATWTSTNNSKLGASSVSGYSGTVFEPIDLYKGDFARTYFYMVTCYEDELLSWNSEMLDGSQYPAFASWALKMLLKWSRNDNVSVKEIDRNNAVYNIQRNRNPFIDYPQLAEYIWGDSIGYAFNPGGEVDPNPDPDPVEEFLVDFGGLWNAMPDNFATNSSEYYNSYGALAFKSSGKYLIITLNDAPDKLSFDMEAHDIWGNNDNHLYVYESADGNSYNMIKDIDNKFLKTREITNSGKIQLSENARYIKFEYQKISQNVGISKVQITKRINSTIKNEETNNRAVIYSVMETLYIGNLLHETKVEIYNLAGNRLMQNNISTGFISLNLPRGLYVVRLIDENGNIHTHKILIK